MEFVEARGADVDTTGTTRAQIAENPLHHLAFVFAGDRGKSMLPEVLNLLHTFSAKATFFLRRLSGFVIRKINGFSCIPCSNLGRLGTPLTSLKVALRFSLRSWQ